MDFYITEKESGTRYALAMLPEKVKHTGSTNFRTYDIINIGEVKQPGGTKLLEFSWSGTFPGESRKKYSFIKEQHWRPPDEMQNVFERWRSSGAILNLMVTETWINHDVMVSKFHGTPKGGHGDVDYDVTFVQHRAIQVFTVAELNLAAQEETAEPPTTQRAEPQIMSSIAPGKTYTVQPGDTMWSIVQRFYGNGEDYSGIYELNAAILGGDPTLIYPGLVITLP